MITHLQICTLPPSISTKIGVETTHNSQKTCKAVTLTADSYIQPAAAGKAIDGATHIAGSWFYMHGLVYCLVCGQGVWWTTIW
ncbi:unnamed protein product [Urochloa humidicola]